MKNVINQLINENRELKRNVEENEQYSKKSNVIINGVPETNDEELRKVIGEVASCLGIELHDYDLQAAHTLPSKSEIKPIIVKFNNYDKQKEMIVQARKLKISSDALGLSPNVPIYIDEHLTKPTIELINQAKNLKKQGKLTTVLCRDGKVKI